MKILAPIKRVVDPYARVKPNAAGDGVDVGGAKFEINPFDEIALEEAVRLKEKGVCTEIVVVSVGPAETEEQLRKALAMGADRAILVVTTDALDSFVVADELKAVVDAEGPQMILMGKQATDDDNNQAAQALAQALGWPQATFASKVEVRGTEVEVVRETDFGSETLSLPLPCLVTSDLRLNEPRYIALPGIIKARSKPLDKRPRSTNQTPRTRVTKVQSPPPRGAGVKVGDVDALLAALRAKGVAL